MPRAFAALSRIDLRPGGWPFYVAAIPVLLTAYSLAFVMTFDIGFARAMRFAFVPTSGVAVMAWPTRSLILHHIFRLAPQLQSLVHFLTASGFSILLYWLRTTINGVVVSGNAMDFKLPDFFAPGAVWMLIEGVLIYALLALVAYIEVLRASPTASPDVPSTADEGEAPFRLFVRQGDEFRPVDPVRIILARGADDYAEVVTVAGTHLVRMTLSQLGERLDPRFIRAHRSILVNVERIGKAEPAGDGRILLHMENGAMITTSRAGARLLREHIV